MKCHNCGCVVLSRIEMIRGEFSGKTVTNAVVGRRFGWKPIKAGIALRDMVRRGFGESGMRGEYVVYPVPVRVG